MSVSSPRRTRSRTIRVPLLLAAATALPAAGQVSTWDPTVIDGLWSRPASWIGGQLPVAGSEVRLNASGNTDVTATCDVGTSPTYGSIYLQNQGTGTARFTLRVDDPLAKLAGVSMSVGSVGSGGSARVVQTQGTVTTTLGGVSLGDGENASGAYELGGGTLRVARLSVGLYGTGSFVQTGGALTFSGPEGIDVGVIEGSSGTFTLTGDAMTVPVLHVGVAGTGSFAQHAGSITVAPVSSPPAGFVVGSAAGGVGTYELYAGASLSTYGDATVGGDGTGTFTQYGGGNSTSGQRGLILGDGATGDGTYNLSNGTLTTSFDVGHSGGARGLFKQSGGSVSAIESNIGVGGSGRAELSGGTFTTTHMNLGTAAGGSGSVELSAGTLSVGGMQTVGGAGTGTFVQTGGTNSVKDLWMGAPVGGVSSYTLSGGELKVGNREYVANSGVGRFVQSGGTNTAVDFRVGDPVGSDGWYELTSGDLNIGQLVIGGRGNGRFVFGGGRLTFTGSGGMTLGSSGGSGSFTMTNGATVANIPSISLTTGSVEHAAGAITLTTTVSPVALSVGGGTYNLRDGASLTTSGGHESIAGGAATFNQYGGANTVGAGGWLLLSGTYNLAGGTLSAGNMSLGAAGALLRQAGGSLTAGKLTVGTFGGTVNLSDGLLEAGAIEVHKGALTQTGGTLRAGGMTVSGGAVTLGGAQDWASGSMLTASGGTVTLASDAGSAQAANLAVEVTGATAAFNGRQHLRSLHVGSGTVTSGDVLVTRALKVDGTGRLDLARGGLVVDYAAGGASPLADVVASILSGRGAGGWDGPGVTSSVAAGTAGVAVGYAEAAQLLGSSGGAFTGEAVDATAVLARVTRAGDANLDGKVDFADLLRLAGHYGSDVSGAAGGAWLGGDFTYDGVVNFSDLLALAKNYGAVAPADPIPGAGAAFEADVAGAFARVPEPTTGVLLGGVLVGCWAGRARRRR